MRILCLEQGDWVKPTDYPSNGRDWEARLFSDFAINPNRRARETDYPINDANSPIKVVNFNGVGGSTIMYTAHYPRLHPSDFKVKTLDGVADDWPVDYETLEPFFAENDRMMGVSGLAGDPAYPLAPAADAAAAARQVGPALRPGDEQARLALVALRLDHRHHRVRRPRAAASTSAIARRAARRAPRPAPTSPTGRPRSAPASSCARAAGCARSRSTKHGMASGVIYYDAEGKEHFQPAEMVIVACNGVGTPRLMLNSQSGKFPNGIANSSGLVGKNLMFHPFAYSYGYVDEPLDGNHGPPLYLWSQEFYETDHEPRLRARLHLPVQPRHRLDRRGDHQHRRRPPAVGRGPSQGLSPAAQPSPRHVDHHRGPAGGAQPRDARSGAEGLRTASRRRASTTRWARTAGR